MPLKIVRNDITKMHVDAIVNTANEYPTYSDGVDTAVYRGAGEEDLLAERQKIGYMEPGEVAITPGFKLPSKHIVHAVSPYYVNGKLGEEEKLRSCYRKSLHLAYANNCRSIAFPLISTGSYGYPKEEAMRIALDEINAFLLRHEMTIYLVVFGDEATKLGVKLYPRLEEYIDQNYVRQKEIEEYGDRSMGWWEEVTPSFGCAGMNIPTPPSSSKVTPSNMNQEEYEDFLQETYAALKERMQHRADSFQEYLLYLIESKGLSAAEVYKSVYISKQLFSKIKVNPYYHPDKATALRLCMGARLNLDETKDLLGRAGYALSPWDKRDIIFSFFIENHIYDILELDIALEQNKLPGLLE